MVDDDAFSLSMTSWVLKLSGYHNLEAKNGLEALKHYEKNYKGI